ncbi:hypothetical protein [uncultured Pseudacidovorax sp.]|uniref:hypothetical protein n=1 Tax=uncultured Pseudacidovorax sp. TaxID=679313 RepID=UPI0025F06F41|nr:hypothetical protein [uncultured Pseudacidovorax sp.]
MAAKRKSSPAGKGAGKDNPLPVDMYAGESEAVSRGRAVVNASVSSVLVMEAFNANLLGPDASLGEMSASLRKLMDECKAGKLDGIEEMLIGQAVALQTVFTSLARRASRQEYQRNYEAFLSLSLKAQAQSRATIQALVELKFPRTTVIAKQANVANGPQQVNNGAAVPAPGAVVGEAARVDGGKAPTELLEDQSHGGTYMDTRAATAPAGSHPAMATLAAINRAAKH